MSPKTSLQLVPLKHGTCVDWILKISIFLFILYAYFDFLVLFVDDHYIQCHFNGLMHTTAATWLEVLDYYVTEQVYRMVFLLKCLVSVPCTFNLSGLEYLCPLLMFAHHEPCWCVCEVKCLAKHIRISSSEVIRMQVHVSVCSTGLRLSFTGVHGRIGQWRLQYFHSSWSSLMLG